MSNIRKILLIVLLVSLMALIAFGVKYRHDRDEGVVGASVQASPGPGTEDIALTADFTVYNMEGEEVALHDYIGKPIVVNFWATWCGPCKSELPAFEKAYAEYGNDVEFLMVNLTDGSMDTVEGVKKFVEDGGYRFPVYFDTMNSAGRAYSISAIPVTVFIDEKGELVRTFTGAITETILTNSLARLAD